VSIKNKLVTAITTAGLLAGLFGSAFVPVARGATTGAVAFTAGSSAEDYNDTTNLIAYYSASVYPQALFTYTPAVGDDANANGAYELQISGATLRGCSAGVTGALSTVASTYINSAATSCFTTYTWAADGTITFNITTSKLAAGASATIKVIDPDGDSYTPTLATTLTGVEATATLTALSNAKTAASIKVGYDGNAVYGETTDVPDTTIGGVDYIAVAQNLGSEFQFGGGLKNGYGTALTTDTTLVISATAGYYVNCEAGGGAGDAHDGTIADGTASIDVLSITADTSLFECRVISEDGAEGAGGNVSVDVKTVSGTVIKTISAGFLGEIASVTLAAAADTMASDLLANVTDFFTVSAKDASGRAYALADLIDADNLETDSLKVYDIADTTKAEIADTAAADADTDGIFDLDFNICGDGDGPTVAGGYETRSVTLQLEDGAGATVSSNAVTLKCGVDVGTALVVDRVAFATSTVAPGGSVKAYVYMEDANGFAASAGDASGADVVLTLTNGTNADIAADGDIELASTTIVVGGYFEVTIVAPLTVGTTISLYNVTSGSVARAYVSSDAYEAALSVGPKKLKATVDFGPAAAKKKIAFVLESTSGTTKTFYRKANASGVATYTLGLRGTWTVYATFGDEISETGTMKK
jgi:hypothetical protein